MMPISEIHEGDMFTNPLWVNSNPVGNIYCVEAVNKEEKLVKVQCYAGSTMKPLMAPFWKKNTDRMFSEAWRYGKEADHA
jgi:hypothetical protein